MTVRATLPYCREMLQLSDNPNEKVSADEFDQRCEAYVRKMIEYDREKTLKVHLDDLCELSPFPEDIRGYLHEYGGDGIFQPGHLMCKIATLRCSDITFEFLVEYGIIETDVEIYYGIKAISDDTRTTEDFATRIIALSDGWFGHIRSLANDFGSTARFCQRHKFTNNMHNGTFWISWVRMESKDTAEDVIHDLQGIYKKFKSFLSKLQDECWLQTEEPVCRFSDMNRNLNKRNLNVQSEDRHPDLIQTLEDACRVKDRNTEDGEPILKKTDSGHYQFGCNSTTARIFIEFLFNKDYFMNKYEQAKEYKSLPNVKKKEYGGSFKKYVEQQTKNNAVKQSYNNAEEQSDVSIWRPLKKNRIDRSWVLETFRDSNGGKFPETFFNRPVKYDESNDFEKIGMIKKELDE